MRLASMLTVAASRASTSSNKGASMPPASTRPCSTMCWRGWRVDAAGLELPAPGERQHRAVGRRRVERVAARVGHHHDGADGLRQLAWLVERQRGDHGLSIVPHTGRGPGEPRPGFDQQPVELWHLAEGASIAWQTTGDPEWRDVVGACAAWFDGANDGRVAMYDQASGGGYDGLRCDGPNRNQGAESTLAHIAVL